MTYLVIVAFLAILGSLAGALFFMMRGGKNDASKGGKMAKALAFRVGFSVLLFLCILLAWKLGYIKPTGFPANQASAANTNSITHHTSYSSYA